MKNIHLIIVISLSLSFTSCGILKHGGEVSEKERMQVDAYAKANIECEYKLAQLQYNDSPTDFRLRNRVDELKTNVTTFRYYMFKRYNDIDGLRVGFEKMVESSAKKLTTCRKLKALEKSKAEKNAKVKE